MITITGANGATIDVPQWVWDKMYDTYFKKVDVKLSSIVFFITSSTGIDIRDRNRTVDYIKFRFMYCYIANKLGCFSLKEIGRAIEIDHSTVIYAKDQFPNICNPSYWNQDKGKICEKQFKQIFFELCENLGSDYIYNELYTPLQKD